MAQRTENDRELILKLVDKYRTLLTEKQRVAFGDMHVYLAQSSRRMLSMKQRAWAEKILEEFEPTYENAYSAGLVPQGKEVEMPAVLRNLPLKPPPFPKKIR